MRLKETDIGCERQDMVNAICLFALLAVLVLTGGCSACRPDSGQNDVTTTGEVQRMSERIERGEGTFSMPMALEQEKTERKETNTPSQGMPRKVRQP